LDGLRDALKGISIEQSTRYRLLIEQLQQIGWDAGASSSRVLLFTESTVTQAALVFAGPGPQVTMGSRLTLAQ
jgi:hypothetical protein